MNHYEFTKDIYYIEMVDNYLTKDNNVYFISKYMLYNGNIYLNKGVNLAYNMQYKIDKRTFKSDIKRTLKERNLTINKLNINDNQVVEMFNYNNMGGRI